MNIGNSENDALDLVIVGAGFAGLYMLHQAHRNNWNARILERGEGVGGTWYWNRYPGARCDVESVYYSYSFDPEIEQEWEWTEKYATQPEILSYLEHVADRLDLRKDISFGTTVSSAVFDETTNLWDVVTTDGDTVRARYFVLATGNLSNAQIPDIDGLDTFGGQVLHTGDWPTDGVDLSGRRVAVIGTGSSGVQVIPEIAKTASHLTVLQRTPSFTIPARNAPLDPEFVAEVKRNYPQIREVSRYGNTGSPYPRHEESALAVSPELRQERLEHYWQMGGARLVGSFADVLASSAANEIIQDFLRAKIDELVDDPATAEALKPHGYPVGAKRVCTDTDYYATFNRTNVELIDVNNDPIVAITQTGISTANRVIEVDTIVFATGYDAMTGAINAIDIHGIGDQKLADVWSDGPINYLGIAVPGFPNLFTITGPGSPSVIGNVVTSIEQHVEWLTELFAHAQEHQIERIEADAGAAQQWVDHVNTVAGFTLFPTANSWYLGANVPGKPRVFMPYVGGVGTYREHCAKLAADGYPGFALHSTKTNQPV